MAKVAGLGEESAQGALIKALMDVLRKQLILYVFWKKNGLINILDTGYIILTIYILSYLTFRKIMCNLFM